jgi:hypothetical protein
MDPFNALPTATAARNILPLKEAPLDKVMFCALVASTDLEKSLHVVKEVTGGAGAPSVKMVGQPASRPWFVANRSPVMRDNHHQCAKVPLVPEVMERTWLVLFPVVRRSGRSIDRSCLYIPPRGSSLRGR